MIFVILGVLFLLVLLFIPIYFFWVKEKADNAEESDNGSDDS